ncbi:MAG: hypothetical protein IRY95_00570 [Clostridia bacterium]|nr:hypothetical protein [Clostridia bacterium]
MKVVQRIAAVVTTDPERVAGGAPIFVARDDGERDRLAILLSRLLDGVAHDLGNGCTIIVAYEGG